MTATLAAGVHGRRAEPTGRPPIARWELAAVVGAMSVVLVVGGNPSMAMQALLEDVAVGAVHRSGDVTVLDLGTVERYATALGRRGLLLPR